jgi:hypothetical protein
MTAQVSGEPSAIGTKIHRFRRRDQYYAQERVLMLFTSVSPSATRRLHQPVLEVPVRMRMPPNVLAQP